MVLEKDHEIEKAQQPNNDYLIDDAIPNEVLDHISSYLPEPCNQASATQTCVRLHSIFLPSCNESAYKKLAQAVIDNDRATLKKILDIYPSRVLFTPSKNIEIQSQLTWQRFSLTENILTIAAKRKQIEMLEFLSSYCNQIKLTDSVDVAAARTEALCAWTSYEMQTNKKGEEEIVIPSEYTAYAQELINVFKKQTSTYDNNDEPSDDMKAALNSLLNRFIPEKAATLDDYLDSELFLITVYRAYSANFQSFNGNWLQLNNFCIKVIGLIQSVQTPETAEKICEGIEKVVSEEKKGIKKKISKLAKEYRFKDATSFYCCDRYALGFNGVGSFYFAGLDGMPWKNGWWGMLIDDFEKLFQAKARDFQKFMRQSTSQRSQPSTTYVSSRCVIS